MGTVCVIGLGYIGLPTAALFAVHGARVIGVDVNPRVIETLRRGEIHIQEPGLVDVVATAITSGLFTVENHPVEADAYIIAVPTPVAAGEKPDLRYVESAVQSIVPFLRPENLVILESTSPPGTTCGLIPLFEQSGYRVGPDIHLAYCPERVLPGRIITELVENDRVVGGHTPEAAAAGAELYRTFVTGDILVTDATTAEMVKLMENTFRDVNIALANEFSRVADTVGIDVHEAIRLANRHPRVNILQPGPGVGGHCIAVDPWFIVDAAPDVTPLIHAARKVNDTQPFYVVDLIEEAIQDLVDPVVALLGLAYKADVDDLRESPSLVVAGELRRRGYRVRLHDACARTLPDGSPIEPDLSRVLDGADAFVILTDHAEYRQIEPSQVALWGMAQRRLVDTRRCLDREVWEAAGFLVQQLGVRRAERSLVLQ